MNRVLWCPGPNLNRHGRKAQGIFSSLHCSPPQYNPLKHTPNALPSCVKLPLDAVIWTHECQRNIPPPGGVNCHYDCDGYRPDTLGDDIESVAISPLREALSGEAAQSHPSEAQAKSKLMSTCGARIIRGCLQTLLVGPQAQNP